MASACDTTGTASSSATPLPSLNTGDVAVHRCADITYILFRVRWNNVLPSDEEGDFSICFFLPNASALLLQ
jgi:hypothetical protein